MRRNNIALFAAVICLLSIGVLTIWLAFTGAPEAESQEAKGAELIIFSEPNFEGRRMVLNESMLDAPTEVEGNPAGSAATEESIFDWNDRVRSMIVVSGTWRLYQHGRCNTKLDEVELADLDITIKEPVIGWSSLVSAAGGRTVEIPDPQAGGWGEDVSSIELVSQEALPAWALFSR